jgi:hypothetical protein
MNGAKEHNTCSKRFRILLFAPDHLVHNIDTWLKLEQDLSLKFSTNWLKQDNQLKKISLKFQAPQEYSQANCHDANITYLFQLTSYHLKHKKTSLSSKYCSWMLTSHYIRQHKHMLHNQPGST